MKFIRKMNRKCNFRPGQGGIKHLTCERYTVSEKKIVQFKESIGTHEKITIEKCFKCGEFWKIYEEYDGHHGYYRICVSLGEEIKDYGIILSLKEKEIIDLLDE